ncbi:hypothetical protein HDU92_003824 [Lobulomyces angularis]|nr:hypothetical protein HDU92_003824 [Lobulomyces angularis]
MSINNISFSQPVTFYLPEAPSTFDLEQDYHILKSTFEFKKINIEPIGTEFSHVARRKRLNRTIEEDEELQKALEEANKVDLEDFEEEEESEELLNRDPLKYKEQDHYAVLGLSKKRWEATDEDIKKAYRRKVLKHHPDKKAQSGGGTYSDSFFKCIQKAWEVLGDSEKRAQWDSVDPAYDDEIPPLNAKGDFFDLYATLFHKTSRFSTIIPSGGVPKLGSIDDPKEKVEEFYSFWFHFQSNRSFEALDEDDLESASCREERRWLDRKNKAARTKRKKEDNARINKLIEQAFKLDPRIKKFKEEEKIRKEEKKQKKLEEIERKEQEKKKKLEELEHMEQLKLKEEREQKEVLKKEKELLKKNIKKEKKTIKNLLKNLLDGEENQDKLEIILNAIVEIEDFVKFRETLEKFENNRSKLNSVFDEKV